ncbi:dienelactone hydrolase family protein [Propionibacteriaceae bacterium Y1685]
MVYRLDQLHADGPGPLALGDRWPAERARIRTALDDLLGALPARGPVSYATEDVRQLDDHDQHRIRIGTADGGSVPALLLVPHRIESPRSAMVALHPTNPDGKASVATAEGKDNRRYGLELVQRGHVVLAPDTITAGDRLVGDDKPFHTQRHDQLHPELSAMGQMLSDHLHCLDLLVSLPQVDPTRIGVIGHSLGGYNAFLLGGADERIAVTVSSCGFATFAGDTKPHRWGQRDWFSHFPALSPMIDHGEVPFEWHEVAALVAPRPFLNWMGAGDQIFGNWQPSVQGMMHVGELYASLGAADRFESWLGHGGHDFPALVREAAYTFCERVLDGAE